MEKQMNINKKMITQTKWITIEIKNNVNKQKNLNGEQK